MKPARLMILAIASCSLVVASGQPQRASAGEVALTVLYDNAPGHGSVIADHGFSCLVEAGGRFLLFDAGRRAETLMANARRLGVDFPGISHVVISHFHGDHTGGLFDALARCDKPQLLLPFSYPRMRGEPLGDEAESGFQALLDRYRPLVSAIIRKKESVLFDAGCATTGMIESESCEQALMVPTPRGLVIITGCAHPGILNIVRRARELMKQDVFLVLGGFHLGSADPARVKAIAQDMRKLTKHVGPCHCTGDKAQAIFRDVFQADYIEIRAGTRLEMANGVIREGLRPRE